jgi:hypothetical protein
VEEMTSRNKNFIAYAILHLVQCVLVFFLAKNETGFRLAVFDTLSGCVGVIAGVYLGRAVFERVP